MTSQTILPSGNYSQKIKRVTRNKDVVCRICGTDKELTLHHVVPKFIGKHFKQANFLKCKTAVLCRDHHDEYERLADQVKDIFADKHNIDYHTCRITNDTKAQRIKKWAGQLLRLRTEPHHDRLYYRIDQILSYLSQTYYTTNDLERLSKLKYRYHNPEYVDFGKFLAETYRFEVIQTYWHRHFQVFEDAKKNNRKPIFLRKVA